MSDISIENAVTAVGDIQEIVKPLPAEMNDRGENALRVLEILLEQHYNDGYFADTYYKQGLNVVAEQALLAGQGQADAKIAAENLPYKPVNPALAAAGIINRQLQRTDVPQKYGVAVEASTAENTSTDPAVADFIQAASMPFPVDLSGVLAKNR